MTAFRHGSPGPPAAKHLSDGAATELTMRPAAIVPMTDEQQRRAVAALAELLLWAMENGRHEIRRAA